MSKRCNDVPIKKQTHLLCILDGLRVNFQPFSFLGKLFLESVSMDLLNLFYSGLMCRAEPAECVLVSGPVQPLMLSAPSRSLAHDSRCNAVPAHMERGHAGCQGGQPHVLLQYVSLVVLWSRG